MTPPAGDSPHDRKVDFYDCAELRTDGPRYPRTTTARPRLAVSGPGGDNRLIEVKGELVIGRGTAATIQLGGDAVSRLHARLTVGDDGWVRVEDLGSTHGTHINHCSVERGLLRPEDMLVIGPYRMEILYEGMLVFSWFELAEGSSPRDGLTGALRKQFFVQALEEAITQAHREGQPLSLVLFDIDRLKNINNRHGHPTGDEVLRQAVAQAGALLPDRPIGRVGGEEFAILLAGASREEAARQAESLRQAIAAWQGEGLEGLPLSYTVSLGVSTLPPDAGPLVVHARLLLGRADHLVYQAKKAGRNRVEVEE